MHVEIKGTKFQVARFELDPGEVVIAESDAMVAHGGNLEIEAKTGGLLSGLARKFFGGESFFQTYFTATAKTWLEVTTPVLGDMIVLDASENWKVQSGAFVARASTVQMDPVKIGGISSWIGGEGFIMQSFSGTGPVVISAMGDLFMVELAPNEQIVIDTGHWVAHTESVTMELGKAARGLFSSIFSGEGFVFRLTGPGKVVYQTRSQGAFLGWIASMLGIKR